MKIRNAHLSATAAFVLAIAAGSAAFAQQPAAAAAPPSPLTGPPIPGVCVFSRDGAYLGSKLGRNVEQRLGTLMVQTRAELKATADALQNDAKVFQTSSASLPQAQQEQKALEFRQREQSLNQLAQVRQKEMEITNQKIQNRFDTEVNPLFELAIRERNCSLVFNDAGLYGANPQMDLTPSVIQKLDAKITEIAFDRANYDQEVAAQLAAQGQAPPAGTGAAAARPASTPARPAAPAARPAQPRSGGR
jgi:outer membrane protein